MRKRSNRLKSVSYYKKLCDKEMSLLVRSREVCDASDMGTCGGPLQHAHVISRRNETLRYDILNALSMCYKHHIHVWHTSPLEAMEWFKNKYPERYNYLMSNRHKLTKKRSVEDYQQVLKDIKERNLSNLVFGLKRDY